MYMQWVLNYLTALIEELKLQENFTEWVEWGMISLLWGTEHLAWEN